MALRAEDTTLAEAIRGARVARGWSRTKLAAELDTGERQVGRWETGATQPSMRQLVKLCRAVRLAPTLAPQRGHTVRPPQKPEAS
jgi:ribosome-binding protein aMBF1 (putative translation factor)